MYNFLKNIFGIPTNDQQRPRIDEIPPNNPRNNVWEVEVDTGEGDDDILENPESHITRFGFPIFNDAMEIHKYLENLMDEFQKKFETFGFHQGPSITWDENQGPSFFGQQQPPQTESLRDSFLKRPGYISDRGRKKEDIDLDGRVKADDLDQFLSRNPDLPNESSSVVQQHSTPQVYSKSVFIRRIRRPDGSIEIIKKVRDNTGKEETTITHDTVEADPNRPPQIDPMAPSDDVPGFSILKKFFSF